MLTDPYRFPQYFHPRCVTTAGDVFGGSWASGTDNYGLLQPYPGPSFQATGSQCTDLLPPYPYAFRPLGFVPNWGYEFYLDGVVGNDGYSCHFYYTNLSTTPLYAVPHEVDPAPAEFICQRGSPILDANGQPVLDSAGNPTRQPNKNIVFDPLTPDPLPGTLDPAKSPTQIVRQLFTPAAPNSNGWAIGWGTGSSLYWDGHNLNSFDLANAGATALNEQNQILLSEGVAGMFLWENGETTQINEDPAGLLFWYLLKNVPLALSNQVDPTKVPPSAPGNDATIHVLANYGPLPNYGQPATAPQIVCTRDNAGHWSFAAVQLPPGVTISQWISINSKGVIAAIGNPGAGYGHAVLLLPVEITVWRTFDGGPPDGPPLNNGVVVTKGDTLTICIDGTSQNPPSIAPNQPVWKISQMQSDGTYSTTWTQI